MEQPSFEESSALESNEAEYHKAIQYLQAQYEDTEKRLAQKQLELQLYKAKSNPELFELQNQTFEFKSQINELKINFMAQREELVSTHQRELESLVEEYEYKLNRELENHKMELAEIAHEVENRNELMRELESKPLEFIKEIEILEARNNQLEEENARLREMLEEAGREVEGLRGLGREKKAQTGEEVGLLRAENERLKSTLESNKKQAEERVAQLDNLRSELSTVKSQEQQSLILSNQKLSHANGEVQRCKRLLETYKTMNYEKEADIKRLSDDLMQMEIDRSRRNDLAGVGEDNTHQKLQLRLKDLAAEMLSKQNLHSKREEELESKVTFQGKEIDRLKEVLQSKELEIGDLSWKGQLSERKKDKDSIFEREASEDKVQELRGLLKKTQEELAQANTKIRLQQRRLKESQLGEEKGLQQKLQRLELEYSSLRDKLHTAAELQQQYQREQNLHTASDDKVLAESRNKLHTEMGDLQKSISELRQENTTLKQMIAAFPANESTGVETVTREVLGVRQELLRERVKAKGLASEKELLEADLASRQELLKSENTHYTSLLESLRKSLTETKVENLSLKSSVQDQSNNVVTLTSEILALKLRVKDLDGTKKKHAQSEEALVKSNQELTQNVSELNQELKRQQQKQGTVRSLEAEKEKQSQRIRKLEGQLEEKKGLEEEFQTLRRKVGEMDVNKDSNDNKRKRPPSANDTNRWKTEREELKADIQELQKRIEEMEKSEDTFRKEVVSVKRQLNTARYEERTQKERLEEAEVELKVALSKLEELRKERTSLLNERKREAQSTATQMTSLKQEVESLTIQKQRCESECTSLKLTLSKLKHHQTQQDHLTSKLLQEYNSQKSKNTHEIRSFQEEIQRMNDQLILEKREYERKNSNVFKSEASLYNHINNANLEVDRLKQVNQELVAQVESVTQDREVQLSKVERENAKLRLELKNRMLAGGQNQKEAEGCGRMAQPSTEQQMIAELETRFKQVQEMNHRLRRDIDPPNPKTRPTDLLRLKLQHSQLLQHYNRLQDRHQELQLSHSHLTIEHQKYRRKTIKQLSQTRVHDSEEMKNLYQQIHVLNNILSEKDRELDSARRFSSRQCGTVPVYSHSSVQRYTSQCEVSKQLEPVRDVTLKVPETAGRQTPKVFGLPPTPHNN